jgi:mannan endo-1,4-beta-mannosidase
MRRIIVIALAILFTIGLAIVPTLARAQTVSTSFVTQSGTHLSVNGTAFRYGGANIYWLGLDENVGGIAYPTDFRIQDALQTAKDLGAADIRCISCGASVGNSLSIEPSPGVFSSNAFSTIDYAIEQAGQLGLRMTIPLADYWNYYQGSIYQFVQWAGGGTCTATSCPSLDSYFYTNPTAISLFEQYIKQVITHVNVYTGVANDQNPTIMDWELGNELQDVPASWVNTISAYVHSLAPNQLISDGSYQGQWTNAGSDPSVDPDDLSAPYVNIYDEHYYPLTAANFQADASDVTGAGKVFVADEYGSTSASTSALTALAGNASVSGADFWDLFAHLDTYGYEPHGDGYSLYVPGYTSALSTEVNATRAFDYSMAGSPVPGWPAPGQPVITNVTQSRGTVTVYWRGTADAQYYEIQAATSSGGSNAQTITANGGSDRQGYYSFKNPSSKDTWFRVTPFAPGAVKGVPSPWQE